MINSAQSIDGNFAGQRAAIEAAFSRYDTIVASPQPASTDLAVAEHEVLLPCQAMATELTPAGDFALDVWLMGTPRHCAVLIATELGIFDLVKDSMDIDELSLHIPHADKALLKRIMRILTSVDVFTQTPDGRFHATKFSHKLSEPPAREWVKLGSLMAGPTFANLDALKANNWRAPNDPYKAGFGLANGDPPWAFFQKNEEARASLDVGMAAQDDLPNEQQPDTTFSYAEFLAGSDSDKVVFVDVDGGNGHVMRKIQAQNPDIKGRFVLLELPNTIADIERSQPPFQCVSGDFFQENPIKGAQVYHIRRCLHDWGDEKCEVILRSIEAAMKPGFSKLLIHEFVLPKIAGREPRANMLDIAMMAISGQERDEGEWQRLLAKSGLTLVKVWRASIGDMAIIEAENA